VPEAIDDGVGKDQLGKRRDARERGLAEGDAHDAVGVIGRKRVADQHAGVDADDGEPLVAQGVHQPDEIVRERPRVVAVFRLVREPDAPLVDGDDLELPGQGRHHEAPVVPRSGPAVDEREWWPLAADHGMQPHVARIDEPARERIREALRVARRSRDGPGPSGIDAVLMTSSFQRSDLKAARSSFVKISGSCQAAKWLPLSSRAGRPASDRRRSPARPVRGPYAPAKVFNVVLPFGFLEWKSASCPLAIRLALLAPPRP
jgi:hypothetical protein